LQFYDSRVIFLHFLGRGKKNPRIDQGEREKDAMAATILIAALLAQSGISVEAVPPGSERVDVGYEELAKGKPNEAIARIRANPELASDDPAALINLGTAYAMIGDRQKAAEHYRAAIASDERYELQLGDGRWMDSRRIARMAAEALAKGKTLAVR
jgi:tetratricopeptide (TPR) repeat protein